MFSWIALAMTVLSIGALAYLRSEPGRRACARGLERWVSDEIPGSMVIGRLESIGPRSAILHDLRFLHPNGTTVLHAKRAEVYFDVGDLLRGRFGFERARVDGGQLVIAVQPDGRTGLEAAFSAKGERAGRPARLELRAIHVENFTLLVRPGGDQTFRMQHVEGFVSVLQHATPGVRVSLDRVRGRLREPEAFGSQLEIVRVDGRVRGNVVHVLDLDLQSRLDDGGRLDAHLAYFNRDRTPVELELRPAGGLKAQLAALSTLIQSWFTQTIDVRVR